jgi:hypothetical protein
MKYMFEHIILWQLVTSEELSIVRYKESWLLFFRNSTRKALGNNGKIILARRKKSVGPHWKNGSH